MFVTARTALTLLRPTARAMRWGPLLAAGGLGLLIVGLPTALADQLTAAGLTTLLRIAAAGGALGIAFLLDDPAARTIPTVPTSRRLRHLLRAGIALPVAGLWWGAIVLVTSLVATEGVLAAVPLGAVTLEAAALALLGLTVAAGALRLTADEPAGPLAAPALLVLLVAVWLLPHRVALIVAPADPQWDSAHRRWVAVLAGAVLVLVWVGREPTGGLRKGTRRIARP
jgi:fluoroquinolone transport system permease protein